MSVVAFNGTSCCFIVPSAPNRSGGSEFPQQRPRAGTLVHMLYQFVTWHFNCQVKAYREDPLVYHRGLKARWVVCSLKAIDEIQQRMGELKSPYLLMHGSADRLVLVQGSEMLHANSRSEDKTMKVEEIFMIVFAFL